MLKRLQTWIMAGLMLGLALLTIPWSTIPVGAMPIQATVEWQRVDSPSESFQKAERPVPLTFPRDLGPHPDFQTEWWYYTGNLETETGRPFGYQLTFFRRALAPTVPSAKAGPSRSSWRRNQVYFSHFTLSDIKAQDFYPHERFSRDAAQLAGAQAAPYRVWLQDWSVTETADHQLQLQAAAADVGLQLTLTQTMPPVLQGDRGYSIKGPEPGNASYYYSQVQQRSAGQVRIGEHTFPVQGLSWTDHEYSTSALSPGTVGWDWFSLQFDDHSALMIYLLRQADGQILPLSRGSFVDAQGQLTPILPDDWHIEVQDHWQSPAGTQYPAQWRIQIPKLELTLQGKPMMANQELNVSTTYWEGAVKFTGIRGDRSLTAKGYVELTGYREKLSALSS